jgi:hypothetical protein
MVCASATKLSAKINRNNRFICVSILSYCRVHTLHLHSISRQGKFQPKFLLSIWNSKTCPKMQVGPPRLRPRLAVQDSSGFWIEANGRGDAEVCGGKMLLLEHGPHGATIQH